VENSTNSNTFRGLHVTATVLLPEEKIAQLKEEAAATEEATGLFENGKYIVDLHSFLVSLSEQEQMPTPPGFLSSYPSTPLSSPVVLPLPLLTLFTSFALPSLLLHLSELTCNSTNRIFGNWMIPSVCYMREARQNLKVYEIMTDDTEYRLDCWERLQNDTTGTRPLLLICPLGGTTSYVRPCPCLPLFNLALSFSSFPVLILAGESSNELDSFVSVPVITERPNRKLSYVTYMEETFVPYNRGTCGWASEFFDNYLAEKLKYCSVSPGIYYFDVGELRVRLTFPLLLCSLPKTFVNKKLLLTGQHPTVSFVYSVASRNSSNPTWWYEVRAVPDRKILQFYLIFCAGRLPGRHMLCSSDQFYSTRFVNPESSSTSLKVPRLPGLERTMGNIFNSTSEDSTINYFQEFISVIVKRRKKNLADPHGKPAEWEEYVEPGALESIFPETACKDLNFWRRGNLITGETQKGNICLEIELIGNGQGWVRKPGFLEQKKEVEPEEADQDEDDKEPEDHDYDYELKKVPETLTLLNLHGESAYSKFGRFSRLFQKLEAWSGVLMWTKSRAKPGTFFSFLLPRSLFLFSYLLFWADE
jgi:hypothetical protein